MSNPELRASRITISIHALIGIAIGWMSPMVGNNWLAGLIGVAVLVVVGHLSEKAVGEKKGTAWWFGNGAFVYLLIWLISWTYFFNLVA